MADPSHWPGVDGVERQHSATDSPASVGTLLFVVVAHMPHHVDELIPASVPMVPMVGDAGDAPAGSAWPETRVVNLADDHMLGAQVATVPIAAPMAACPV
jgi:hypothetical protein